MRFEPWRKAIRRDWRSSTKAWETIQTANEPTVTYFDDFKDIDELSNRRYQDPEGLDKALSEELGDPGPQNTQGDSHRTGTPEDQRSCQEHLRFPTKDTLDAGSSKHSRRSPAATTKSWTEMAIPTDYVPKRFRLRPG